MTDLTRYRERPDVIVDRPDAVLSFLRHLDARGELVSYEPAREVLNAPDRIAVRYVRREVAPRAALPTRPAPARWSVRRRAAVAAGVVAGAFGVLGVVIWAVWTLVSALVANIGVVLVVLGVAAIVRARLRGGSSGGCGCIIIHICRH
jgi:hypothetical protein